MDLKGQESEQLTLSLIRNEKGCNPSTSGRGVSESVTKCSSESGKNQASIMEEIVERENLRRALKRVEENRGSAGVDGMEVEELSDYLKGNWLRIKTELLAGTYNPKPVKRVQIKKPDGGIRNLGVPTVLDRFIQQAVMQVLQSKWDGTFSENSYGFRPSRSAHQAILQAQEYLRKGKKWVVDMDIEKFFDRVNHDILMCLVRKRIQDKTVMKLLRGFLNAGVMEQGVFARTEEGAPQGGPLSPLLSNLMLNELDKELEKRGHSFARYADDCNIYVNSQRAGLRVMESVKKFLGDKLRLKVNEKKSAVDRPWNRKFLGFSFSCNSGQGPKRKISPQAIDRFKDKIRKITNRTRGISLKRMVKEVSVYLKGWMGYFRLSEEKNIFRDMDCWIRRRFRSMLWKQWGRKGGYWRLVKMGVSKLLAWNTFKSAHGPWRLSHSPALEIGLNTAYFDKLGLPRLTDLLKSSKTC